MSSNECAWHSSALPTDVLAVNAESLQFDPPLSSAAFSEHSVLTYTDSDAETHISRAAHELQQSDVPVAFPTETVYGLGADATRSAAVKNIFAAKGRPADNPLIVHVHSISQLRSILTGPAADQQAVTINGSMDAEDPIPPIYRPLIRRFWPGPLTIILRNPRHSPLAEEVTAGLSTFGARMPSHPIALALLKASVRPLAAPSANASTKPSPTTAAHVFHDLNGRIRTIVDGGPCGVGVESTVVDGLSDPPTILRPGGISLGMLNGVEGWERVTVGYHDKSGKKSDKPRSPGMKYKHYSPKATVVLFEAGLPPPSEEEIEARAGRKGSIGVIRTARWPVIIGRQYTKQANDEASESNAEHCDGAESGVEDGVHAVFHRITKSDDMSVSMWDVELGKDANDIAKGLFAALRLLDLNNVDIIFVEGIEDGAGDAAAAVMNRLRKAAEVKT